MISVRAYAPRTNLTPLVMDASSSGTILSKDSFSNADSEPISPIVFTPSV